MSAWDEVAIRAMCNSVFTKPCEYPACDGCDIAHCEFPALAPHLAARDAAVWAQACEAMREHIAGKLFSIPEVADRIRALAPPPPDATP